MDWEDHQQNFIGHDPEGGSVELNLTSAEPKYLMCLASSDQEFEGPRMASVPELFRLKCIAAATRTETRNLVDLYLLLGSGQFGPLDFIEAFDRAGVPSEFDFALVRMTAGKPSATDRSCQALLTEPPNIEQMKRAFVELQDKVQQELAARAYAAAAEKHSPN